MLQMLNSHCSIMAMELSIEHRSFAICRWTALLVGALGWLWSAQLADGAVLLDDPFTYQDGSLVSVSGGVWVHHSGSLTGEVKVVSESVLLSQTNSEDVSMELAGQPYPPSTNLWLYASMKVRFSSLPSGQGTYFAHFKAAGTSGFAGKIFATTNGAAAGSFRVGIANTSSSVSAVLNSDLSLQVDYVLVLRYAVSNSVSTLWLNPAAESDASVTATDPPGLLNTIAAFALRQSLSNGDGMGTLSLDNLIVATTFSDLISSTSPPSILNQPQSQAVLQGAPVTFAVLAVGSPPLAYQWQRDGTNLAGATGSALSLIGVTPSNGGAYSVTITNAFGSTNSQTAVLTVITDASPGFTYLTYNVKGNGATNWTTNAPQVQAVGREVMYLNPDVIAFNEIPNDFTYEMTNFVKAFLPGYFLATNSASDGFIRSVVASRFPIRFSRSYLHSSDLNPYGYTNSNFTRDLFQAVIDIPGFAQSVHVFSTHLKSGQDADSSTKRSAESSAISNFLTTVFLATNHTQPYLLSGDMNEDIADPPSSNPQSIQHLVNPATGLFLTTPVNPFTQSRLTFSIQNAGGLTKRYDYIMPATLLLSNITGSQVFRTDLLPSPPPPLLAGDDATASDHLPVFMAFANPYTRPFRLRSLTRNDPVIIVTWESVLGQSYRLEGSSNLLDWRVLADNLVATGASFVLATNLPDAEQYLRVYRIP